MNKREYCESRESVAYYSGLNGLEIKGIEYEEKARAILSWEDKRQFEEKQIAVENLLKEFCKLNGGVIYE